MKAALRALRRVPVDEAVGLALGHDHTQIIAGQYEGARFRRGHVVRPEDVEVLRSMGKEHVYVLDLPPGWVHEEEAAARIAAALAGEGVELTPPHQGRVNLRATARGYVRVAVETLAAVNAVPDVVVAAAFRFTPCKPGDVVAGTRVTPLLTREEYVARVEAICRERGPVISVASPRGLLTGVVVVGTEVVTGRIQDSMAPVLRKKLAAHGCPVHEVAYCPDDAEAVRSTLARMKAAGCRLLLAGGGMSVDPDDVTPEAIEATGARVVTYGVPVLPGSMFLLAYWDDVPVLGVPTSVIHDGVTFLDVVLPRLLVGDRPEREEIVSLGHGGLLPPRGSPALDLAAAPGGDRPPPPGPLGLWA